MVTLFAAPYLLCLYMTTQVTRGYPTLGGIRVSATSSKLMADKLRSLATCIVRSGGYDLATKRGIFGRMRFVLTKPIRLKGLIKSD
jgi:hypothetical protein